MSTSTWHHSHWSETLHVQGTAVYGEFELGTVGTIWHSPLTNLLFPPQARRLAPSLECQTQHDKSHRNRKNQFPTTAYGPTQNVVPRFQDQVRIWNRPVFKLLKYSESTNFCGLGFESATISLIVIFGQTASTVISFLETFLWEILGVADSGGTDGVNRYRTSPNEKNGNENPLVPGNLVSSLSLSI